MQKVHKLNRKNLKMYKKCKKILELKKNNNFLNHVKIKFVYFVKNLFCKY